MGLLDTIKGLFAEPPKRMAGAMVVIKPPEPNIRFCYEYKMKAEKLKINGWVGLAEDGILRSEIEGPFDQIQVFLKQLDSTLLTIGKVLETRWLPYNKSQFADMQVRLLASEKKPGQATPQWGNKPEGLTPPTKTPPTQTPPRTPPSSPPPPTKPQ
jgi:acylphosphatase